MFPCVQVFSAPDVDIESIVCDLRSVSKTENYFASLVSLHFDTLLSISYSMLCALTTLLGPTPAGNFPHSSGCTIARTILHYCQLVYVDSPVREARVSATRCLRRLTETEHAPLFYPWCGAIKDALIPPLSDSDVRQERSV